MSQVKVIKKRKIVLKTAGVADRIAFYLAIEFVRRMDWMSYPELHLDELTMDEDGLQDTLRSYNATYVPMDARDSKFTVKIILKKINGDHWNKADISLTNPYDNTIVRTSVDLIWNTRFTQISRIRFGDFITLR